MELKPFLHEAQVKLTPDFTLHLALDFAAINRIEGLLDMGLDQVIGRMTSSVSVANKFLWAITRNYHSDLSLDVIAGLLLSPEHRLSIMASLGGLVTRAFPELFAQLPEEVAVTPRKTVRRGKRRG